MPCGVLLPVPKHVAAPEVLTLSMDSEVIIEGYVESIEKDIKEEYRSHLEESFQENKDDVFVYQCLKSLRSTRTSSRGWYSSVRRKLNPASRDSSNTSTSCRSRW